MEYGVKSSVTKYHPPTETETRLRQWINRSFPQARISSIEGVKNKYLSQAYELKKLEIELRYRNTCEVKELLHATSTVNVEPILKNNLNWRLVRRAKYGKGVSFSHDAKYANKYCNNRNGDSKAFIICNVLMGRVKRVGDNSNEIPRANADTYVSNTNLVYVKFDDFMFNPQFVVYYRCVEMDGGSPLDNTILLTSFPTQSKTTTKTRSEDEAILRQKLMIRPVPSVSRRYSSQTGPSMPRTINQETSQIDSSTRFSAQYMPEHSRIRPAGTHNEWCTIL